MRQVLTENYDSIVFSDNLTTFFFLKFQQSSTTLKLQPTTFEELKTVLTAISDIRNMAVDIEMKLFDIQERYRTLAMYKVEVVSFFSVDFLYLRSCTFYFMWNIFYCRLVRMNWS